MQHNRRFTLRRGRRDRITRAATTTSPAGHRPPSPTSRGFGARPALAVSAALLACSLLAACGGSSSGDPTGASGEQQNETKLADFAKCMREHGVNAEVAAGPFGGRGVKVGGPGRAPQSPGVMEAAQKACKRFQPQPKNVNLSPQQKVEREEAVQKFARCMREHGIKVEASTAGGGFAIRIHSHPGEGPNPESPGFQNAQNTCQKLLPFKGGPPGKTTSRSGGPGSGGASLSLGAG